MPENDSTLFNLSHVKGNNPTRSFDLAVGSFVLSMPSHARFALSKHKETRIKNFETTVTFAKNVSQKEF